MSTGDELERLIGRLGPMTGAELREETGGDPFDLWKTAMLSSRLEVRTVGTRYLRLDRQVDGFARLSPSILREFLTYSIVGLSADAATLDRRAAEVRDRIRTISCAKRDLAAGIASDVATRVAHGVTSGLTGDRTPQPPFCIFIAGDVVYDMAHDVPRPERSTGKMVRGSDLDLVVVVDDAAPEPVAQALDAAIYQQKYRHLISPSAREEIDYIVKRFRRLREQAAFDTFKRMVACKILEEGELLCGSRPLFDAAKALLLEHGVTQKLSALEAEASRRRRDAERALADTGPGVLGEDARHLLYSTEESEEFE